MKWFINSVTYFPPLPTLAGGEGWGEGGSLIVTLIYETLYQVFPKRPRKPEIGDLVLGCENQRNLLRTC